MRHSNGAGAGDLTTAGPLSESVICGDTHGIAQSPSTPESKFLSARRARLDAAKAAIAALSELFPAAFVGEKWEPHKPLKVGIRADLIATELLTPSECSHALRAYTGRLQYQKALAAGGPRFGLDGNPTGEVTSDEVELAVAAVARVEAKRKQKAAHKAARERSADQQRASRTPPPPAPPPTPLSDSTTPRRDGLADLKRAAAARKRAPS